MGTIIINIMKHKAPGKFYRKGLSLRGLLKMFPDDATARKWFIKARWPNGICCPCCGSVRVQTGAKHKTMPYRCRDCRKRFSPRTGTALEASNLKYDTWVIAIYLLATSIKGVSSMRLRRDLDITQKSAWFLAMRLRKAWENAPPRFLGPVEVDETYIGGKERNKHADKKLHEGRGAVGKTAVIGAKDRATNKVAAEAVPFIDKELALGFIGFAADKQATIFTDESPVYSSLKNHEAVCHSVGEFVREQAHTNGLESFWALLKRGFYGQYHKMSAKHLNRYVQEFAGRHNIRGLDTLAQMSLIAHGLDRKRLRYRELVG